MDYIDRFEFQGEKESNIENCVKAFITELAVTSNTGKYLSFIGEASRYFI